MVKQRYTNNEELAQLITCWQRARKRMAEAKQKRLIEILYKIAGGVWDRYEFTDNRDDFCQDCILRFFEKALRSIDPARNCFSYLTTCAVNYGQTARKNQIDQRRHDVQAGMERLLQHFGC